VRGGTRRRSGNGAVQGTARPPLLNPSRRPACCSRWFTRGTRRRDAGVWGGPAVALLRHWALQSGQAGRAAQRADQALVAEVGRFGLTVRARIICTRARAGWRSSDTGLSVAGRTSMTRAGAFRRPCRGAIARRGSRPSPSNGRPPGPRSRLTRWGQRKAAGWARSPLVLHDRWRLTEGPRHLHPPLLCLNCTPAPAVGQRTEVS